MLIRIRRGIILPILVLFGSCLYTGTFLYLSVIEESQDMAQCESRIKQIFITSPSTFKDDGQKTNTGIEIAKHIQHLRELVINVDDLDAQVIPEETPSETSERPQQVHQLKRTPRELASMFVEGNTSVQVKNKLYPVSNKRDKQKKIEELIHYVSNDQYFPVDSTCPHLGLRKEPYIKLKDSFAKNKYCVKRQPSLEECQKATRDYEVESPPSVRCEEQTEKDLCTITEKWRSSRNDRIKVRCDVGRCGKNPIYAQSLDPESGQFESESKWRKFVSKAEIEANLPSVVIQNSQNGISFCIIRCLRNNTSQVIRTVLSFPPILADSHNFKPGPATLSINIVVMSSTSRPHFYRSLPETVATLRNIVYDNTRTAFALDFEFLQSLASDSARNLQALLSGNTGGSTRTREPTLFSKLIKLGYQNLFQSDQCWNDKNEMKGMKENLKEKWEYFQTKIPKPANDAGMTYLACQVISEYSGLNQLDGNRPNMASCLNGRYLFTYIFDYIAKLQHALTATKTKAPVFSYTYLTLTKDNSGVRVKQLDKQMSGFLQSMTREQNTLTIVTSDQGPTTSKYSLDSIEGRYEIYDPFLFMIIPKGVSLKLGKQQMEALIKNQHRLISLVDLHNTLVSIGNLGGNQRRHNKGLLAELPENRTCADVGVNVGSLCKCRGWETWFPDNDPRFTWVAEFALGELNNLLQESMQDLELSNRGHIKCQRFIGFAIEKIHHGRDKRFLSLDLIVHPSRQVFETQVHLPNNFSLMAGEANYPSYSSEESVKVLRFRNGDFYQDFAALSHNGPVVNLYSKGFHVARKKTVITKRNSGAVDVKYDEDVLQMAHRSKHFGARPQIQVLDRREKCLLLITRAHFNHTVAYEVLNICVDRTFVIKVDTINREEHIILTVHLPMIVQLAPGTFRFLFSGYKTGEAINLKPKIAFRVVKVNI